MEDFLLAKPDEAQNPLRLAVTPTSDGALKGILLVIALLLVALLWRGITVRLTVAGESGSDIPVFVTGGQQAQFELQTATRPNGAMYITRLNKQQGTVEVFSLDDNGKLTPVDQQ
jgi:hypothetical protein